MKTRISRTGFFVAIGAASLITMAVIAQTSTYTAPADAAATATPDSADSAPATLPPGVEDVLRLTRAQVGDDVTVNYIQNSGTAYNLSPNDVAYLKDQGVSDRVINAMADPGKDAAAGVASETEAQIPPNLSGDGVPAPEGVIAPPTPMYAQPAPQYVQQIPVPVPVPVQLEPAPASTLYIIPDPASGATARFYPSGNIRSYAPVSSVVTIGSGYVGGHRYYATAYHMADTTTESA